MLKPVAISALALALTLALASSASAAPKTRCERILERLGDRLAPDASCVESPDLTTNNPNTTPLNNSIPGLPAGAFTPQTDRTVIAPDATNKTPITKAVPGVQINGRIVVDPKLNCTFTLGVNPPADCQARFLLRLPDDWNGRLVVAGASGTRSEFNGDFAWSDYVVQKGYAYASQNKGVFNLRITSFASATPPTANSCRLNPLTDLPPAVLNFPDYVASGRDPNSTAAKNIRAAGYPPDIVIGNTSLWTNYSNSFWEVTQCQWQKRLDPTYDTYGTTAAGLPD